MDSSSSFQKRAFLSALAAFGVHAAVFAVWILFIVWDLPSFALDQPRQDPRPEPEMTVVMLPLMPKAPPKPAPTEAAPQELAQDLTEETEESRQRFARTSEDQEGKPDAPTDILGERDTRAASEVAPTPGAKANTPAQKGAAPLYPGHIETVNRTYKDGSVGKDQEGDETEMPQEASAGKDGVGSDLPVEVVTNNAPKDPSQREQEKHMAQGEILPIEKQQKSAEEDSPKEKPSEKEMPQGEGDKDLASEGDEPEPKRDGFSGYSRQTAVVGSISRFGKSALNVRNSPLGRYQALVGKAVELQWRRNCEQHRDHIVPGVISIRFYVDKNGGVSGIKFQEVIGANYIERGFTQRAIRQAELPRMSESVVEELKGEPLELIYNFYF
ncbi:MAG: hypothetical protein ACPH2J_07205 [Akkermansiaceae bacterium]